MNSRMRAVMAYLRTHCASAKRVYFAEATTRSFKAAKSLFGDVTGSEYLGAGRQPGSPAANFFLQNGRVWLGMRILPLSLFRQRILISW